MYFNPLNLKLISNEAARPFNVKILLSKVTSSQADLTDLMIHEPQTEES